MKISLVIPAYNESAIIENTVNAAVQALSGRSGGFELIIVDDGSTDNTADILATLATGCVSFISYRDNRGKGGAVKAGMKAARGDLVFFTDADLAYGLDVVEAGARLMCATGADMVIGSRKLQRGGYGAYPGIRLAASKCFSLITGLVSGMKYDTQCGIKGFRKPVSDKLFPLCLTDGFSFDFEIMLLSKHLGCKVDEFPVKILNHRDSRVSMLRDSVRMLREITATKRRLKRKWKKSK